MGGEHVGVARDLLHHVPQPVIAGGAGVGLVTPHHRRPLLLAHGAGAGVGQQVNVNLVGPQGKDVVARPPDGSLSLLPGDEPDGFDHLDLEGLASGHGAETSLYSLVFATINVASSYT